MLKDNPIQHDNRKTFVLYLCRLHNNVNIRLGKPEFDCNNALKFWGGDCGCDDADNKTPSIQQIEKKDCMLEGPPLVKEDSLVLKTNNHNQRLSVTVSKRTS